MQVVAYEDVEWMDVAKNGSIIRVGIYLGTPGKMGSGPEAFLTCLLDSGASIQPHFHDVDQFQVCIAGDGRIGRHDALPITVQYADAFGPYGPITANDAGLQYLVLRPAAAGGHFEMPERADLIPGRLGRTLSFRLGPDCKVLDGEDEHVGLKETRDDGLMVEERQISPFAVTQVSTAKGPQYVLLCEGSLDVEGRALGQNSLIFFDADDAPISASAGAQGARLLSLRFPLPSSRPGSDPAQRALDDAKAEYDLPASYAQSE